MSPIPSPSSALRRLVCVLLALAVVLLGGAGAAAQVRPLSAAAPPARPEAGPPHAPAAPAALGRAAPPTRWDWPLSGRPAVVRPFQPPPAPWLAGHRGVDLAGSAGSPVLAAGDGVVAFAGLVAGFPAVSVEHPGGLRTTYEPVVATVRRGTAVRRGDVLGVLAAAPSHCSPAVCLHWGLRRGATYLDPLTLLGVDLRVRLLPVWDP